MKKLFSALALSLTTVACAHYPGHSSPSEDFNGLVIDISRNNDGIDACVEAGNALAKKQKSGRAFDILCKGRHLVYPLHCNRNQGCDADVKKFLRMNGLSF